jgi:hypothetical protein
MNRWAVAACAISVALLASLASAYAATNLVFNASFERTGSTWLDPWALTVKSGSGATITQDASAKTTGLYSAKVAVTSTTGSPWLVQLSQPNVAIAAGQRYEVAFSAKASTGRTIQAAVQQTLSPYTTYASQTFTLTTGWTRYTYSFTSSATQSNTSLRFNLAATTGSVWIDNVWMAAGAAASGSPTATATASPTATTSPTPSSTATPTGRAAKGISWYLPIEYWGSNTAGMLTDVVDMEKANVGWARIELDRKYAVSATDTVVQQLRSHGISVLMTVENTYPYKDLGTQTDRDRYKAWLRDMVLRYKANVKHWEIMNEVNLNLEWNIDQSLTSDQTAYQAAVHRYVLHLQDSYETIKANDPTATVLFSGLSEWRVERYIDALAKENACPYFDLMAYHPFGKDPDAVMGRFNALKSRLALKACLSSKPIWITEIGFNTSAPNKAGYVTSEQLKSDYLKSSLLRLRAGGARLPIFVFSLHGFQPGSSYGLEEKDPTTLKTTIFPAYWMYRDLAY